MRDPYFKKWYSLEMIHTEFKYFPMGDCPMAILVAPLYLPIGDL